ncbi:MAG: class I SAM-dependent methyltransferase [bacterium]
MSRTFEAEDWNAYRMAYGEPHRALEAAEREGAVVHAALAALVEAGALPRADYDGERFLAHRAAVAERFEIPWTAITPRMQRLLYAVNAIAQPQRLVAAGVFCGNTFISNAGAAVGPGACYEATDLLGVEIRPEEAQRAERNVRRVDPTGVARVVADDAIALCRDYPHPIDLLYLDADGGPEKGKGIYYDILQAALDKLHPGSLVLAHNSVNCAQRLAHYLAFVRDPAHFAASVNVILDPEGLEVTVR